MPENDRHAVSMACLTQVEPLEQAASGQRDCISPAEHSVQLAPPRLRSLALD